MRVANTIEILEEIKTDNGDILEIFRFGTNLETEEQFFSQTGVKIGVSTWF